MSLEARQGRLSRCESYVSPDNVTDMINQIHSLAGKLYTNTFTVIIDSSLQLVVVYCCQHLVFVVLVHCTACNS